MTTETAVTTATAPAAKRTRNRDAKIFCVTDTANAAFKRLFKAELGSQVSRSLSALFVIESVGAADLAELLADGQLKVEDITTPPPAGTSDAAKKTRNRNAKIFSVANADNEDAVVRLVKADTGGQVFNHLLSTYCVETLTAVELLDLITDGGLKIADIQDVTAQPVGDGKNAPADGVAGAGANGADEGAGAAEGTAAEQGAVAQGAGVQGDEDVVRGEDAGAAQPPVQEAAQPASAGLFPADVIASVTGAAHEDAQEPVGA